MMFRSNKYFHLVLLGLAVALAAFIRFRVAPLSAGPDVAQFWAFAEVFRQHGLDFYRYSSAQADIFPFKYWAYVYPPVWLLILGLALLTATFSPATDSMVDAGWRLAAKTPIILADLAIGILLYWAVPGSKFRKLLYACLWLFNPTAWYNSAVFGQFDAIAAAFLIAAIITLERGSDRLAFALAALAAMTKQNAFIPFAVMVILLARQMPLRRLLSNCAIFAGVGVVLSIPFLITGNFEAYAKSIFLPGQEPGYQNPLVYAFNGFAAVLTYLHNLYDWNTDYFQYFIVAMALALIAVIVMGYLRRISVIRGALMGILIFVAFFYRINYQYLLVLIPLALLVAAITPYRSEKALSLVLALFPALWIWMFDVSFWFNYLDPKTPWISPILAKVGLSHASLPDVAFVVFAAILTGLCLAYVVCAFTIWKQPLGNIKERNE